MIYVYRQAGSTSARALADALHAVRFRGRQRPIGARARAGDLVVCWGEALAPIPNIRVLNGAPIRNKYTDAITLRDAGVRTVEVSLTRPAPVVREAPVDPAIALWNTLRDLSEDFLEVPLLTPVPRTQPTLDAVRGMNTAVVNLAQALNHPAPAAPPPEQNREWLPRLNGHVGGNDLLNPPTNPDFWAKKEDVVREFRVHSFMGRSLRAGVKRPRNGFSEPGSGGANEAHPWIRSYDAGWAISYDGVTSRQAHRTIAHNAIRALGLDFGAVDIAELRNGDLMVLEVNRAPGIEGGTLEAYRRAIRGWVDGAPAGEEV